MIPKRIPILRTIGWILVAWAIILFFLFWILMSPSNGSSTEMRTAYFIITIPESVKISLVFSAIILPIGLLLLRYTIYYRPGSLTFCDNYIELVTRKWTYQFAYENIIELQISAGRYVHFFPNISTLIVIVEKDLKKHTILLCHYQESENFYQLLTSKGIKMGSHIGDF